MKIQPWVEMFYFSILEKTQKDRTQTVMKQEAVAWMHGRHVNNQAIETTEREISRRVAV